MENTIEATPIIKASDIKKLWQLVELAQQDMKSALMNKKYKIDMDSWLRVDKDGNVCAACLGGCFLLSHAEPIRAMRSGDLSAWNDIDRTIGDILDSVRIGWLRSAVSRWFIDVLKIDRPIDYILTIDLANTSHVEYDEDYPEAFFMYLDSVVEFFKSKDW